MFWVFFGKKIYLKNQIRRATFLLPLIKGVPFIRTINKNVWKSDKRWEPVKFSSFQVVKSSSFHVYAQKCQVVRLTGCQVWSLGHAEQLLFSCLCSKVTVYCRKLQWFFDIIIISSTLSCEFRVHKAGSQLIIGIVQVSVFVW